MEKSADIGKFKKIFKEWILPFGIEIAVILLLINFVFFLVVVPTGSMIPTIDSGSMLFATHIYNPEENIKRGDILVFYSDELQKNLVKRVIGLPGETVTIDKNGKLYVDGKLTEESYVVFGSNWSGSFDVPEGCYLFLGDNRAGSYDARTWKEPYIHVSKIKGRAVFTLWPLGDFGTLK